MATAAPSKPKRPRQSNQESFDFIFEVYTPPPAFDEHGGASKDAWWTKSPNSFYDDFVEKSTSLIGTKLVARVLRRTIGGFFDENTFGERANKMKGKRPNWYRLDFPRLARDWGNTVDGVKKALEYVAGEVHALKLQKRGAETWAAIDEEAFREMPKPTPIERPGNTKEAREARKAATMPTVNLPASGDEGEESQPQEEVPLSAVCPKGEECPLIAKYAQDPQNESGTGEIRESSKEPNQYCSIKTAPEPPPAEPTFSAQTPVVKPGQNTSSPLGMEIDAIRVRDAHGSILSTAASYGRITAMAINGRLLDFTVDGKPEPAPDELSLKEITRRLNKYVPPPPNDKQCLADRLGSNVPPSIAVSVYNLIPNETAWNLLGNKIKSRWSAITSWGLVVGMAKEANGRYVDKIADERAEGSHDRDIEVRGQQRMRGYRRESFEGALRHWDELSPEEKAIYRAEFPSECPTETESPECH